MHHTALLLSTVAWFFLNGEGKVKKSAKMPYALLKRLRNRLRNRKTRGGSCVRLLFFLSADGVSARSSRVGEQHGSSPGPAEHTPTRTKAAVLGATERNIRFKFRMQINHGR